MTTRLTPGPRERLLQAAQDLTYAQGMAVGVDALLKAANVAGARCTNTSGATTA